MSAKHDIRHGVWEIIYFIDKIRSGYGFERKAGHTYLFTAPDCGVSAVRAEGHRIKRYTSRQEKIYCVRQDATLGLDFVFMVGRYLHDCGGAQEILGTGF